LGLALQAATSPAGAETSNAAPISIDLSGADATPLAQRVGPADPEVIAMFADSGASNISDHSLTAAETDRIDRAIARLPRLHRDALRRHLSQVSFLDLQSGAGSAVTRRQEAEDGTLRFDITFRASLLDENLRTFLNTKESRLFKDDGSGVTVAFDAGASEALTYVLLHEATHIVDQVAGLTDEPDDPVRAGLCVDLHELAEPFASAPYAPTIFRGEPPIPL
jgi:hypothetical protein